VSSCYSKSCVFPVTVIPVVCSTFKLPNPNIEQGLQSEIHQTGVKWFTLYVLMYLSSITCTRGECISSGLIASSSSTPSSHTYCLASGLLSFNRFGVGASSLMVSKIYSFYSDFKLAWKVF
jgi:hypothetical protein